MSFFSSLGSFIGDAQQLGDEFSSVKDEFVQQVASAATQVSSQVQETGQELVESKDAVLGTLRDSSDSVRDNLESNATE